MPLLERAEQAPRPARGDLRLVPAPRLRVVDVALLYGERSGGIRTYLEAKRAWVASTGAYEHHVVTPHDVPSLRVATANGYRVPIGVGALKERLAALEPDVVVLHDPFWGPQGVARTAHALGAAVVVVHHGSVDLSSASVPVPAALVRPGLRRWMRHAYREADAVMSAVPTLRDCGRRAELRLRFGLDPAFVPREEVERGDDVVCVGRLAREKGVLQLVDAAARSAEPWPLRFVGSGPLGESVLARAHSRGIGERVTVEPYVAGRTALARLYASAACVVMPGAHETFGLVAFEAAASGARVVCCTTAPSAGAIGALAHTFAPRDVAGLSAAIDAARAAPRDPDGAARLAAAHPWPAAFAAEHADLRALRTPPG